MGERLRLERTLGVAGWQAWAVEGDSFVLAALGRCLLHPVATFAPGGIWRLVRRWRNDAVTIDARALRLALCMDEGVALTGVRVCVTIAPPSHEKRTKTFTLSLQGRRNRQLRGGLARGAAEPPADRVWTVLRLAAGSEGAFARMRAALYTAPRGSQVQIEIAARRSHAPDTLRVDFPLRVEGLFDAADGWFPVIRESRIDASIAAAVQCT